MAKLPYSRTLVPKQFAATIAEFLGSVLFAEESNSNEIIRLAWVCQDNRIRVQDLLHSLHIKLKRTILNKRDLVHIDTHDLVHIDKHEFVHIDKHAFVHNIGGTTFQEIGRTPLSLQNVFEEDGIRARTEKVANYLDASYRRNSDSDLSARGVVSHRGNLPCTEECSPTISLREPESSTSRMASTPTA